MQGHWPQWEDPVCEVNLEDTLEAAEMLCKTRSAEANFHDVRTYDRMERQRLSFQGFE